MKYLLCLLLAALSSIPVYAQSGDWVTDSLDYYDQKIEKATEQKDFEAVRNYYYVLFTIGKKSLDIAILDRYRKAVNSIVYEKSNVLFAKLHQDLGVLEFYREDHKAAEKAFRVAARYFRKAGMNRDAAGMSMNLGVILERSNKLDEAILAYHNAMSIFIEESDTSTVASCLENIALAYNRKGDFTEALDYFSKTDSVLATNTPAESPRWIGFYYNKSKVFENLGNYEEALKFVLKGLRLSETSQDERQLIFGYSSLLDIYEELQDNTNWLKYTQLATLFYIKTDNKYRLGSLFNRSGNYYLRHNQIDSANHYALKSLNIHKNTSDSMGLANSYILKGGIEYQLKNYKNALDQYKTALLYTGEDFRRERAGIFQNLGATYMELGEYKNSEDYLLKSLVMRKQMGSVEYLQESYQTLANNMEKQARYKEAYTYHLLYKQYQDSIFNETKSKQITQIQTQFDTENKDREIADLEKEKEIQMLLSDQQEVKIYVSLAGVVILFILSGVFINRSRLKQRANKLLEAKNSEIAARDKEKETLLKEIHHRVKNNLQVISSLLSMQSRGETDNKVKDAVKESQSRVKTMALIHEKLYQYDNLSRIAMKEYFEQLSEFIYATFCTDKQVNIVIEAEAINLDIETAVPLGLITNELLSNALKYAFEGREGGEVKLILSKNETNGYKLTVSDTGNGLDEALNIDKAKSLGLKLVRTLTRQLDGKLNIQSSPGATFTIEFTDVQIAA